MGQTVTIDVAGWQAVLGLIMAVGGVAGMVGLMLRLWMQPQVGSWIDKAMKREREHSDEQLALIRNELHRCQVGRAEWRGVVERQVESAERRWERGVDEIKGKLDDLVEELAGVREQLGMLTGRVSAREKVAQ